MFEENREQLFAGICVCKQGNKEKYDYQFREKIDNKIIPEVGEKY